MNVEAHGKPVELSFSADDLCLLKEAVDELYNQTHPRIRTSLSPRPIVSNESINQALRKIKWQFNLISSGKYKIVVIPSDE